jgi:hypothetical protein
LRLAALTGDDRWRDRADRALRAHAPTLAERPTALAEMLLALDFRTDAPREVVLVWPEGEPAPAALLQALRTTWAPNKVVCGAAEGPALARLAALAPVAAGKRCLDGRPTAYVCEQGSCRLPVHEPAALAAQLREVRPYR